MVPFESRTARLSPDLRHFHQLAMSSPTPSTNTPSVIHVLENPEKWNQEALLACLKAKQKELYLNDDEIDRFRKNNVAGIDFLSLTQHDLQAVPFNLTFGSARRIIILITLLKQRQACTCSSVSLQPPN